MLKRCDGVKCDSKYQDKRYGKNRRVHNPTAGGSNGTVADGWKCTVCGKASGPKAVKS